MNSRTVLVTILAASLIVAACTLPNISIGQITPGPTVTEEISVPVPAGGAPDLTIAMGGGTLDVKPGAASALVVGTVTYNIPEWKPEVTTSGSSVHLQQGQLRNLPRVRSGQTIVNEWDLQLGSTPMALTINAGAAKAQIELGGLSLTDLTVNQGASEFDLGFSEPDPTQMGTLHFAAGASKATLMTLANANVGQVEFRGGAGDYTLDFSGELRQDTQVSVEAGAGQVTIVVPNGVAAETTFTGALANVDVQGNWQKSGGQYVLVGTGYKISFDIRVGVGNVVLRSE
jgi:hypothetical protein